MSAEIPLAGGPAYPVTVVITSSTLDLSLVSAVSLAVRYANGDVTSWTATITAQTTTSLTLVHTPAVGHPLVAGTAKVQPQLTNPSGTWQPHARSLHVLEPFT